MNGEPLTKSMALLKGVRRRPAWITSVCWYVGESGKGLRSKGHSHSNLCMAPP